MNPFSVDTRIFRNNDPDSNLNGFQTINQVQMKLNDKFRHAFPEEDDRFTNLASEAPMHGFHESSIHNSAKVMPLSKYEVR